MFDQYSDFVNFIQSLYKSKIMETIGKLSEDVMASEESLKKQAKKIILRRNGNAIKRPTHLFMHEKCLAEIVSTS